jgi:carboxypeptidase Taq
MGVVRDLAGLEELLDWDQETLMPAGGAEGRARTLGTVAALHHRELARADIADTIEELSAETGLSDDQRAMVRLAAHDRLRAVRVPEQLTRAESECASRCSTVWRDVRDAEDFPAFAAALRPLVAVKREVAHALADGGDPYDALLDEFEPGARSAELETLFDDLCERLVPIVHAASAVGSPSPLPDMRWDEGAQMELARTLAEKLGFDLQNGAIGLTTHPFTSMHHAGDVRFSTSLDPRSPVTNVMVVLHEAGHALYDQGLPHELARTCLFKDPSMGAQESQSRFYEMHVGCTTAFWRSIEPELTGLFPDQMAKTDVETLARTTRVVRPGLVRLEADEVTYNLHIAVRFRLESRLVRGELEVDDLPEAWANEIESLLGVRPKGHRDGVMQDIHWAAGLFGYFPTYTLGNLYAAQLRLALERDLGPLEDLLDRGAFGTIREFMRERVHGHGRRLATRDLMEKATGMPLGADALVTHLEGRYLPK